MKDTYIGSKEKSEKEAESIIKENVDIRYIIKRKNGINEGVTQ